MNLNNLIQYCREMKTDDPLIGISVPEPINADAVRSAIVVRCGMLTPVYSDPDVFRSIVRDWFYEKQWTFKHLVKVIKAEYSPIENVEEFNEYSDVGGKNLTHSGNDTTSGGYTNTDGGTETTENTTSAENSSTYQPDNRTVTTGGLTLTNVHNDTTDRNYTDTEDNNVKHVGHRHGNIGVTTNTQLIDEELELLRHFDVYTYIAKLFESDMMLLIY